MKTTLEMSDGLLRAAKAAAASRGRSLKQMVTGALERELKFSRHQAPIKTAVFLRNLRSLASNSYAWAGGGVMNPEPGATDTPRPGPSAGGAESMSSPNFWDGLKHHKVAQWTLAHAAAAYTLLQTRQPSFRSRVADPLVIVSLLLACHAVRAEDAFEQPPEQRVAALLPAALAAGADYHVADPVHSDGLMYRFDLDSTFGRFEAYGLRALARRAHEIDALTALSKLSSTVVVAGGVTRGVVAEIDTVVSVATHPFSTVLGIPKGVAHLFRGYADEGQELVTDAERQSGTSSARGPSDKSASERGSDAAQRYAKHYFGLSSAERRWYEKLGVDPYTDNLTLRQAVQRTARLDAAASFGMRFVTVPAIPAAGLMSEATDAIYHEKPATLRARARKTLLALELSAAEIEQWQNSLVLSPTFQVALLQAASALSGVADRAELFRHSLGLTSTDEAQVYLHSVELLLQVHQQHPLTAILVGVRLPTARTAEGRIIVCGAFEAVYWTREVADSEAEIRRSLPAKEDVTRELWLAGAASPRTVQELQALSWTLHPNAFRDHATTPASLP